MNNKNGPQAGRIFETKNRAIFLERFFGRGIFAQNSFLGQKCRSIVSNAGTTKNGPQRLSVWQKIHELKKTKKSLFRLTGKRRGKMGGLQSKDGEEGGQQQVCASVHVIYVWVGGWETRGDSLPVHGCANIAWWSCVCVCVCVYGCGDAICCRFVRPPPPIALALCLHVCILHANANTHGRFLDAVRREERPRTSRRKFMFACKC